MANSRTKPKCLGENDCFPHKNNIEVIDVKSLNISGSDSKLPLKVNNVIKDLPEYFNSSQKPTSQNFRNVVRMAVHKFDIQGKVKMLHINDVFKKDLDIWTKYPGLPWSQEQQFKCIGDIKADPESVQSVRRFWHFIKQGRRMSFPYCCHRNFYKNEIKVKWNYPATITIGEAVFAVPLIEAYKILSEATCPVAYNFDEIKAGDKKFKKRFTGYNYYVQIHFSKFNEKVPAWLIDISFDILMLSIDFVKYEGFGITSAEAMIHMFDHIRDYFINTKFKGFNGQRFQKKSGIASDSCFSNLISSISKYILVGWMYIEQFGCLPDDMVILNDYCFLGTSNRFSIKQANDLVQGINIEIDPKSSVVKDFTNVKFL